jgi:hypothetical protein
LADVLFSLRYSARKFVRTPGLTLALLLTIALGIGSDVSVYGFIRGFAIPHMGMTPQVSAGISRIARLLAFAAGAVFFIACANVVSFLLGRAFTRSPETSLRVALGAGRWQLARELVSDSIVISVAGGACGMLLALWTSRLLPALLFEQDAERLVFAPDLLRVATASVACVGMILVCGFLPVILIPYDRPASVLRRESAGSSTLTRRLRATLVVTQMTSCCLLLICTAFLFDGLRAALRTNFGRSLGQPILAAVQGQITAEQDNTPYFRQVQQAAHSVPGVSALAWVEQAPGNQPVWRSFRIDPQQLPLRDLTMDTAWFTAGSLKSFALPPKAGRLFGFQDQMCRVAIVNESAAAELFGAFPQNTIGRVVQDSSGLPIEIIGVLAKKENAPASQTHPTIYYNHADQSAPPPGRAALAHFRASVPSDLASIQLDTNVVSTDYFGAMGLSLIAGREFTGPSVSGECRVGVINREAADLYFGDKPVGAAVIDDRGVRTAIIGVVRSRAFGTFQRHPEPAIYFPMRQDCPPRMTLIAGVQRVKSSTLDDLRRRIESVPGRGPAPVVVETLATHLAHTALAPLRIATVIIGASATTALLLSILGLFGALSDAARQRRHELAIRIALGSQRWRVIYQVLQEGGRLAATGSAAGILASFALSRLLAHITPVNSSPALWVWLVAPLLLAVGVVIASILPARRALLVNPLTIMRDDNS